MGNVETGRLAFNNGIYEALLRYPKLFVANRNGKTIIAGEIDLVDINGELRDTYSIEIHPSGNFPFRFPYLFETGGKIPKNIDWHVFESTGHCCICVEPEEIIYCKEGITITKFIDEQVIPYLFNQTFRRINGYFINERSHGFIGTLEFYKDKLCEANIFKVIKLLTFIKDEAEPNRVTDCFCGSGEKYRKCHRESYRLLNNIGPEQLEKDISVIKRLLNIS